MQTTYTKAKQTSRGGRVWLENKAALESAGFVAGARYDLVMVKGVLSLFLNPEGASKVSSCKRNGVERPIIDLHSKAILDVFAAGTALQVRYVQSLIAVMAVEQEEATATATQQSVAVQASMAV